MLGLMGRKIGMTQVFAENGDLEPVTAVEVGPCTVVLKRGMDGDGYCALQLGFGPVEPRSLSRAERGHLEKKGLPLFKNLREFRLDSADPFEVGDELTAAGFKPGDVVNIAGVSKGRGFQGVMKRHGKHGGPASHGSDFHRRPGSIGMRTWPARVPKNTRLPGHMGDERVTTKGLTVVGVRPDDNVILVRGSVPGAKGGMLLVFCPEASFAERPGFIRRSSEPAARQDQEPAARQEEAVPGEQAPQEGGAKE